MMKKTRYIKIVLSMLCLQWLISCEDIIEVDIPDDKLVSEVVFNSDETALSVLQGTYYQLFNAAYANGNINSVTVLSGLSADLLEPISTNNNLLIQFSQNELLATNTGVLSIWSSAYNIIYITNSSLEGIDQSNALSEPVANRMEGEMKFIRAFTYFYLVNLYGEVPLVLSTDYHQNSLITRTSKAAVYDQIILDLQDASELLEESYVNEERFHVNKFAAIALMARVYLYLNNWAKAEELSGQVIGASSQYELLPDLDQVFLANSREAIWQISPKGRGNILTYTWEGASFIGNSWSSIQLTDSFVSSLSSEDLRKTHWIGYYEDATRNFYYASKYKDRSSINNITEYSMVLRLAEQYLIRAESRTKQGNLNGGIEDLDKIRERAGLPLLQDTNPGISQQQLLDEIMEQRKLELFTEWGHRWLDLKRTAQTNEILNNPSWKDTDNLYPIPADERSKNPNLGQNPGY